MSFVIHQANSTSHSHRQLGHINVMRKDEAAALVLSFVGPAVIAGIAWLIMWGVTVRLAPDFMKDAEFQRLAAIEQQNEKFGPAGPKLNAIEYVTGRELYAATCVACHGAEGQGVPNLGKDLVHSTFVRKLSDTELPMFIAAGRAANDPKNTSGVAMPPKGGRDDLNEPELRSIAAFVRGLNDPRRIPSGPLPKVELPAPAPVAAAPAPTPVTGGGASTAALDPQAIARGKRVFISCIACHGKEGAGVKNLGKDLVHSSFVAGLSDADLATFIKKGRGPTDPGNSTKIAMPPKGGNPALKDEQITDVVTFIRSLQLAAGVKVTAAGSGASPAPAPSTYAPAPASNLDAQAIIRGKRAFVSCMACHGKDGTGVKNLGKDLVHSSFVKGLSDADLATFIKKGRGPTDPGNTTKIAMPPKGGNPALKDEQINDIIVYLRSISQASEAGKK